MTKEELLNGEFLKQFKDSKDFGNFIDTLAFFVNFEVFAKQQLAFDVEVGFYFVKIIMNCVVSYFSYLEI